MVKINTTALIVEYNPFHNGHQYHLNQSKKISQNDNLIVLMSGNFSQRADPTLLDKWARTKAALSCGADLVIELPLVYNIRSAEYFAHYSILTLENTKIVDSVVFGSESGNIKLLTAVAEALINEKKQFKDQLKFYLEKGFDFPTARSEALIETSGCYQNLNLFSQNEIKKVLNSPNNILAVEYLKSLLTINSKIKAQTIKRRGSDYHSLKAEQNFASASMIRTLFNNKDKKTALKQTKALMPLKSWEILKTEINKGRFVKEKSRNKLLTKTVDIIRRLKAEDLKKYKGITNGLENRFIEKSAAEFKAASFLNSLKSKNLTESRLKRKLLQIYFELNAERINKTAANAPHYLRVLGVKKGKEFLISQLNKYSELNIIINPAQQIQEINLNSKNPLKLSLSYDLLASDLYSLLYENNKYSSSKRDFYQKLIKV